MGETIDSILNLPAKYDELSEGLAKRLTEDFARFGLALTQVYINSITPPPEVQQAIDDRSRMGVFDDMNKLMQMKAAMAMEKASEAAGEGAAGMGMGTTMGLMMPAMFAQYFAGAQSQPGGGGAPPAGTAPSGGPPSGGPQGQPSAQCPDCKQQIPIDAHFCPSCGHQLLVFTQCSNCGKNMTPNAKFCSRCGTAVETAPKPVFCPQCGAENLPEARFCNSCGEKI
jgi:membrane protease subunit (stomatin/prohibitin family)